MLQATWPARGGAGTPTLASSLYPPPAGTSPKHGKRAPKPRSWRDFRVQPLISQVRKLRPREGRRWPKAAQRGCPEKGRGCPSRELSRPPAGHRPEQRGFLGSLLARTLTTCTYNTGPGIREWAQTGKLRHGLEGLERTSGETSAPPPYLLGTFHPGWVTRKADGRHLIHHSPDSTS